MCSFASLFPVLSVLPSVRLRGATGTRNDKRDEVKRTLDACACLCVWEPEVVLAVTIDKSTSPPRLLIASNRASVPDIVVTRINKIFHYLIGGPSDKDADTIFRNEQYSFSWSALRSRIARSARIIDVLEQVVTNGGQLAREQITYAQALFDVEIPVQVLQTIIDDLRSLDRVAGFEVSANEDFDRIHEAIGVLKKTLTPDVKELLNNLAVAFHVPIQVDMLKIIIIHDDLGILSLYRQNRDVADWLSSEEIMVQPIQPGMGFFDTNFDPEDHIIADNIAQGFVTNLLDPTWPPPLFSAEYRTNIVPKIEALRNKIKADHAEGIIQVPLHPECTLFEFVHKSSLHVPYIGTSEWSCLLCYRFIQASVGCDGQLPGVRATDGRIDLPWAPPDMNQTLTDKNKVLTAKILDFWQRLFARDLADVVKPWAAECQANARE